MKSERTVVDHLHDIRDAMEKAEQFVTGIDFEQFAANVEKVYAVIRALEIIGAATKELPKLVRNKYPKVPWREMAGMRDKLIHDYAGVNLMVVWKAVKEDIPALKPLVTL